MAWNFRDILKHFWISWHFNFAVRPKYYISWHFNFADWPKYYNLRHFSFVVLFFMCVSFQHFRNFWINMEPKCKLKIHFYLFLHTTDPPPPQFTLNEQNHVSICLWSNSNFAINTPLTSIIQQNHFFHFTCFCMSKTYFISRSNLDNALSPNSITFVFGWKNLLSLWGVVIGKWGGGRSGGKLNVRTKWAGVPNFGHSMIT